MSPVHEIVLADADDIDTLSALVALAFERLAPSVWLVPDTHERRRIFPAYFRLFVADAMERGLVYTTPERTATALWFPVAQTGGTSPAGYDAALAAAVGPWLDRFRAFDAALAGCHPRGMRHDHLAILAVHPGAQHGGVGSALLAAHHRHLERTEPGVPAYLEASDQQTRRIYLARGYADHGDPIRLPHGPLMHPMLRPASATAGTPPLESAAAPAR